MSEREYIGPNGERRCPYCKYETRPHVPGKRKQTRLRTELIWHLRVEHDIYGDADSIVDRMEREAVR